MKQIDLANWPRRSHYEHFRGVANPHFGVTAPVDVTPVMEVMKRQGLPVFDVVLFALMRAANQVAEFRTRFRGDAVVEHKTVHASFTVPIDEDGFAFCEVETTADFRLSAKLAGWRSHRQRLRAAWLTRLPVRTTGSIFPVCRGSISPP